MSAFLEFTTALEGQAAVLGAERERLLVTLSGHRVLAFPEARCQVIILSNTPVCSEHLHR